MYELRIFGTHLGEFHKVIGSMNECLREFYIFCSKNIIQQFTFEKVI